MRYRVDVKRTQFGYVVIEAEDAAEAVSLAFIAAKEGQHTVVDDDFSIGPAEEAVEGENVW